MKRTIRILAITATLLAILLVNVAAAPYAGNQVRMMVEYNANGRVATQSALKGANAQIRYDFSDLNTFAVTMPAAAVNGLANNPSIASIEVDPERHIFKDAEVPAFSQLLDTVDANGQTVPFGVDAVQARDLWDADRDGNVDAGSASGAGITVCIIDTGFYAGHEDLSGITATGISQHATDWTVDGNGHGSHVAGTIAAVNNSVGVVGVTPGAVNLHIVKFFNDEGVATSASDLIAAAYSCRDNGADIISMSLGGDRSNQQEKVAFNGLYDNDNILNIAAAGNDGNTKNSYPASYDGVMSVAAIDEANVVADFSQQTTQVEIAAPGVSVLSTVPYIAPNELTVDGVVYPGDNMDGSILGTANGPLVDGGLCDSAGSWSGAVVMCARGDISFEAKIKNAEAGGAVAAVVYNNLPGGFGGTLGTYTSLIPAMTMTQEDGQFLVANKLGFNGDAYVDYFWPVNGYSKFNGTSMATPHVSAVAALVWSGNPTATNADIRNALNATALDLGAAGRDVAYGYGLVQAYDACQSLGCGAVVNAPPSATISSPADSATFASGASISFAGSASDNEDGDVTASLSWSSDIDGAIGSGASFNATLSDGTHTITAVATDSGSATGSDSITITVGDPPTGGGDLVVTVSTDLAVYGNRDTVYITVNVTDGANAVEGATVDVTIVTAGGTTLSGSTTTDANGDAVLTYKVNSGRDGKGTYSVSATASLTGYNGGSGSTTFQVQ